MVVCTYFGPRIFLQVFTGSGEKFENNKGKPNLIFQIRVSVIEK